MRKLTRLLLFVVVVGFAACQSSPPGAPSGPPSPPPTLPPSSIIVTAFSLTQVGGTARASDLGWVMALEVTRPVPGMFVRVDLQAGSPPQGNSCYASEAAYAMPITPQHLELHAAGFTKSPFPGSSCDAPVFHPNIAEVRVFAAADTFAQSPVGGGDFSVFVTLTE